MRIIAGTLLALGLAVLIPGCGGGSGSDAQSPPPPPSPPSPPPPPAACNGFFPGMAYVKPVTGPEPPGIYLASSDGCRSEFVHDSSDRRGVVRFYASDDLTEGLLIWREEPGGSGQEIVMRQDFTVAQDGTMTLEPAVKILPRPGEEPVAGDIDLYLALDIWGGSATDTLYLTVSRFEELISANGEQIDSFQIYDLNDMSQVRELFREVDGVSTWDCPAVPNPQYVSNCYNLFGAWFNPSGTRLYLTDNRNDGQGNRWDAILRIDVDRSGDLADWTIGDPEIVVTAPASEGPAGAAPRPGSDRLVLPNPEIIGATLERGSATGVIRTSTYLDADQCVELYAPFADGNSAGQLDLWMQCVDDRFLENDNIEGWQTPDTVVIERLPESPGLYRFHVSGAMAGTEELLIENGENPDTGL